MMLSENANWGMCSPAKFAARMYMLMIMFARSGSTEARSRRRFVWLSLTFPAGVVSGLTAAGLDGTPLLLDGRSGMG